MVKELPALGCLYNNVCNDVTCAGMPVVFADIFWVPCAFYVCPMFKLSEVTTAFLRAGWISTL